MSREGVLDAFRQQSAACEKLGSPFMGRLMALCAERLCPGVAVADRVLDWPGDPRPQADNVPLRLAGALHALRLKGKALTAVYPPQDFDDDRLWSAILDAFESHEDHLISWLAEAPQTNEVRRSAAILPAMAVAYSVYPASFELLELGTSGALNLRADQFLLNGPDWRLGHHNSKVRLSPEWQGSAPPLSLPNIVSRSGVDVNPLNPFSEGDRLRLLAYIWPDQTDRIERTLAAISIAAEYAACVEKNDAGRWLESKLGRSPLDTGRFVFHTVASQYFPYATRRRIQKALDRAGRVATPEAPLVHFQMEADEIDHGAGLTLTIWPGEEKRILGRADFHGRWIEWTAD